MQVTSQPTLIQPIAGADELRAHRLSQPQVPAILPSNQTKDVDKCIHVKLLPSAAEGGRFPPRVIVSAVVQVD